MERNEERQGVTFFKQIYQTLEKQNKDNQIISSSSQRRWKGKVVGKKDAVVNLLFLDMTRQWYDGDSTVDNAANHTIHKKFRG